MSKKLEGNGLWESSRMMLPEHRERLIKHRQGGERESAPRKNIPTTEEINLVREYALLPLILSIVETNLRSIENTTYSLRKLYVNAAQALLDLIHTDLVRVRKVLKERNIKVYEEERIDNTIQFRFICRGYEDNFTMIRDVVRAEASVRIAKYIAVLFRK
ncbi:hypothetical protein PAECIP111893_00870 [Paenibacillus plantiphilus]|uniref:Phage transcriptional regulator, ArpU family n=1 Tax=Paenibacillus plantiphilus TaxID=2905650 RepID=A0ABM9BYN9_9BACL|nr:hypothetical protein [Paenibacillus plantiphilus]CAH1197661.1 hypothetical protein PAECIP111893_00870 [Paenibacillus plantiphilus]